MLIRVLVLALVSVVVARAAEAQDRPAANARSTVLDNGLEVIVIPNARIPMVTLQLALRAGAATQTREEEEGIPHLIEHVLFRSGNRFEERAQKIDAAWNGVTSSESVRYIMTFPSAHLNAALQLMSDLVRKPSFSQSAIEAERKVVQGELERNASDPMGLLYTQSEMLLWEGDAWRGKNAGGNLFALNGAKPDMLKALHARYYVPNNAALVMAGDIGDSAAFSLAERHFGGWKRGADVPVPTLTVPPLNGIKRKVLSGEVRDVTILARWHGPSVGAERDATYAADVFAGLVNQPLSGTQKRLVDGGIMDAVSFAYETANLVGPISLAATAPADQAVAAIEALGREIELLARPDYFSDEDLELARKRQRVGAQYRLESASSSSHVLAGFWSAAGMDYYVSYDDALERQSRTDVERFVAAYIRGKPLSVVVMVPPAVSRQSFASVQRALGAWRIP